MPLATFSGLASGIDSNALIKALIEEKKKIKIKPLQNEIKDISSSINQLNELKSLAQKLASKAQVFSPAYGGPVYRKAQSSDENKLTASASSNATNGTYNINVTQLASTSSVSFNTSYSSSSNLLVSGINDSLPGADRTVTIKYGQGSSQVIKNFVITSTTTVQEFIDSFNNQFSGIASAVLVNVGTNGSPDYRIFLKSAKTGLQEGMVDISVAVSADPALSAWNTNKTVTQAQDLNMTITGISGTITKSSNTFSDLLPGVSFNVKQTGSITLTVSVDSSEMTSKLGSFVEAFNDVVKFVRKNNKTTTSSTTPGESIAKFAPLSRIRVDDSFVDQVRNKLITMSAYNDPPPPSAKVFKLTDLGITTTGKDETGAFDGTLAFDSSKFSAAMQDDFQGVINLLTKIGNELATTTGLIEEYTAYNKLFDTTTNSLNNQKKDLETRLSEAEKALLQEEDTLLQTFARLESTMGRLRSIQTNLAQALASLPQYGR
ncbi:MAG: flagellar filament capping protein FliD [Deltaproteobacteria bacterium]|nr:flagellar filament capping protein FliD [Deltaproteobacteria bacterium]